MANNNRKNRQPEDIFAETEAKGQPKNNQSQPARGYRQPAVAPPAAPAAAGPVKKGKGPIIILFVFALAVLLGIGYVVFGRGNLVNLVNTKNKAANTLTNTAAASPQQNINIDLSNINQAPADADKDGLSDAEEKLLGTNPNSADSDADGLFDREEVKVYKTDPLKADTDGDGIIDGQEVKNGYNPNGPGKLLDLPSAIQNVNK